MTINLLTCIGVFALSYWLVFKFMPWVEGKR